MFDFQIDVSVRAPAQSSISEITGKHKNIFLYLLSIKGRTKNLPVWQVLSQVNHSDFISAQLNTWKYKTMNHRMPDEAIMDKSNALLLAVVKSFTFCGTTSRYLSQCYDVLFESADPPTCYIRLDRSHMVNIIKHIKELQTEDRRKRKLFERTFGYVMLCDDILQVETLIRKIFILLLNKYETDDYVRNAKKELKEISDLHITHEVELDENYEDDNRVIELEHLSDSRVIECENLSRSKFFSWINSIKNDVEKKNVNYDLNNSSSTDACVELADNIYYGPHLIKPFHELLATVPLWSNVMMKHFKSTNPTPTSSGCEVEFKNIKRLLFNNMRAIRVDSFVQTHMQQLDGQMKLALSEQKKLKLQEANDEEKSNHVAAFDEVHQEIWKNKNSDAMEEKKKFRINRSKTSIITPIQPTIRMVPILRNGHKIISRNKSPTFIMSSTCSFDAIFHGFAAFYLDDPIFKNKVENDDGSFSKLLRTAIEQQDKKLTYEERNNVLLEAFADKVEGNAALMMLDCDMAIATMYMRLCDHNNILCSLTEYKVCKMCDQRSNAAIKAFVPTRLNDLHVEDLQDSITLKTTSRQKCSTCLSPLELEREFFDKVAFDIENTQIEIQYTAFEKITATINLNNREYFLKAVVERKESSAHFIVHIRRKNDDWESIDDLNVFEIGKPPEQLHVVLLIYCAVDSSTPTTNNAAHSSDSLHCDSNTLKQINVDDLASVSKYATNEEKQSICHDNSKEVQTICENPPLAKNAVVRLRKCDAHPKTTENKLPSSQICDSGASTSRGGYSSSAARGNNAGQTKGKRKCGICKEEGHTRINCTRRPDASN